ncbi:phage protease [Sandaracinus amylolyticus]|uniref:Mu-like prophage FluMu I protein n=1 Tax=Sandaracinus amylolyticus TaxID=927083 RepID=A0A0F6W6S8_9BACT|nr:phage protease [Sandaracinus amylolyticus]AKF08880.1 Mu-like prophage FluMu I protein [Sandaracinus amylolyticus]
MHAYDVPRESASRGVRLVARLVMDARPGPAFVPEVRRAMVAEDSKRSWVHLVYEGTWEGHRAGTFTFDGDRFAEILRNFDAQANELVFDYEHATEMMPSGEPVPAAGWIHALAVEGDSLFAYVEWTARAASLIEAGEYRFCSVVVDFAARDRKTDEEIDARLLSVALTNIPFIDGQEPIRLSARPRTSSNGATQMGAKTKPQPKKTRVQLSSGAKALLDQIATLLKITLADGDDVYFKVMDALGALQQAAKVEDMLATSTEGPALSDRRIRRNDVLRLALSEGTKITREQLLTALEQIEGDDFTREQLAALIESVAKMAEAQDGGGSSEPPPSEPAAASEPPPALSAPAGAPPAVPPHRTLPRRRCRRPRSRPRTASRSRRRSSRRSASPMSRARSRSSTRTRTSSRAWPARSPPTARRPMPAARR